MRDTFRSSILTAVILLLGTVSENMALAQAPALSWEKDLKSQYPKGTVLNLLTTGVVGTIGCKEHPYSTFKDGKLHAPGFGQNLLFDTLKCERRPIAPGTQVYLSDMQVYQKNNHVSFAVMQDAVLSQVDFEFPKGFLATAQLGQILEAIHHVFTIVRSPNDPAKEGAAASSVSPPAPPVMPTAVTPGSLYVNSQNKTYRLQLHPDNSFSLQEGGQPFTGSYSVAGSTLKLHIAQLEKDVDIVIQNNALVVNGAEIWSLAPGPLYVNSANSADKIQLNSDGAFTLQEGSQTFTGTYSVAGATLKLHITQLQKDVDIAIQGNQLIVNGNESWISAETASADKGSHDNMVNNEVKPELNSANQQPPLAAQSTTAKELDRSMDALLSDIEAGKEVSFPIKYNGTGPNIRRTNAFYSPDGGLVVHMADGVLTLSKTTFAFSGNCHINRGFGRGTNCDFQVSLGKILELENPPGLPSRLHVKVPIKDTKSDKEDKKDYYFYNAGAQEVGDGTIGGPGTSIICNGCDNSMDTLFALLNKVVRLPLSTTADPTPQLVGHYVYNKNAQYYLDLKADGSFYLMQKGKSYTGSFAASGDSLIITMGETTSRAQIIGETIKDDDGMIWVKQSK